MFLSCLNMRTGHISVLSTIGLHFPENGFSTAADEVPDLGQTHGKSLLHFGGHWLIDDDVIVEAIVRWKGGGEERGSTGPLRDVRLRNLSQ